MNNIRVPKHVAIIMDGNGRWAIKQGLARPMGHLKGMEVMESCVRWTKEFNIPYLTLYAFSTENWRRPREEVEHLKHLLDEFLKIKVPELKKNDVRLKFIGDLSPFSEDRKKRIKEGEEKTQMCSSLQLNIALNYGGKQEILHAIREIGRAIMEGKLKLEEVDLNTVGRYLYTSGIPDPDLIIRTAGEMRLSNFLLWQSAYSELYVTPVLWPDFKKEDYKSALEEYGRRERHFGG